MVTGGTPSSHVVERPSFARAGRIALCGILAAGAVSVIIDRDPAIGVGHSDLDLAIPVPATARLVERRIDLDTGRSIAVLDVDPATPPAWDDIYVVTRRHDLPGVQIGFATEPVEVPTASASIDAWRAFAAGSAVRVEPHADLRSASAVIRARGD
jgi:hypothetical protein